MGLVDRLWRRLNTRTWSCEIDGRAYLLRHEAGLRANTFSVASEGRALASETLDFYREPFRMQELRVAAPGGELAFQTAPRTWLAYGFRVNRNGSLVAQSHPDPFAKLAVTQAIAGFGTSEAGRQQAERAKREVWPAFAADILVGLVLYLAAGSMSLRDTAILGAALGLALQVVQWLLDRTLAQRINVAGGLSGFAVLMLAASAALAWYLESDLAIQLKGSVLGFIGAALLGLDGWLGGRYFGKAMASYITFVELDPRRVSLNSARASAALALAGGALALWASRDAWLLWRHWVSPVLGLALGILALARARKPGAAAGGT